MKITVATRYFFPSKNGELEKKGQGADIRIYELYRQLAKSNSVSIVVQNFSPMRKFSLNNLRCLREQSERMEIIRTPCLAPFFFLTRLPMKLRFFETVKQAASSEVIIAEFHAFHAVGLEALIASRMTGKKLVLDIHDAVPEKEGGLLKPFMLAYERFMYDHADGAIVCSDEMKSYVEARSSQRSICAIENGVDTSRTNMRNNSLAAELGLKNSVVVGIIASLTSQHGIEYLLHAFRQVKQKTPNSKLLIVGEGRERKNLEQLAAELGMKNEVVFTGLVPYAKIAEYASLMDVFVAPFPKGNEFNVNFPLKLSEYLAFGKPIVVTDGPVLRRVIDESGAGAVAEAENAKDIAEKILWVMQDKEKMAQMGRRGREYAQKNLDWGVLGAKMEKFLKKISG